MLSNPKVGQKVTLHYCASKRRVGLWHGRTGVIVQRGKGKPRNHLVRLEDGMLVCVPAGHLRKSGE